MPFFKGQHASVTIDGNEWASTSWALTVTVEKIEISDFDQKPAKFMQGMMSSTISLEGHYEYPMVGLQIDSLVSVVLYLDFELDPNAFFAAKGVITEIAIKTEISDIASIQLGITVISDFSANSPDPWEF